MHLLADQHTDARRAVPPAGLDIPAFAFEQVMPCREQAHEVAAGGAGDEPDACAEREPERLQHPALRDRLDRGSGGRDIALYAFWSHAETSQSAARAAGSEPPTTSPK